MGALKRRIPRYYDKICADALRKSELDRLIGVLREKKGELEARIGSVKASRKRSLESPWRKIWQALEVAETMKAQGGDVDHWKIAVATNAAEVGNQASAALRGKESALLP